LSIATDQADDLRNQAISILLAERELIDAKLASLSYDGTAPTKKPQKPKLCGICQQGNHTSKTCPKRPDASPTSD
jgi:hypothetical protein